MLTSDEIEAAALGARWVQSRGDPALSRAAADLIAKLAAIVPERLRDVALDPVSRTGPAWEPTEDRIDLARVRGQAVEARALELGATLADPQPGDTWRVLIDPAGHPFCLTDAANW